MKNKIKILALTFITIFIMLLSINTNASNYDYIQSEVTSLIELGELPKFHTKYKADSAYQTLFIKMYEYGDEESRDYFKSMTSSQIVSAIKAYKNDWDKVWYDIITNLDVEPQYLDPFKVLGLYYDGNTNDNSYLYLIWTSNYIPSEFMTINSFELNGKEYSQYPDNDLFKPFWYDSKYYYYENYDLSLHLTPIGGFEDGKQFGVPLTQTYEFKNIKVGIDKLQFNDDPDPTNEYSKTINSYATFNLGMTPTYKGKSACQLVTHAYKLIKDCEVQSYYDLGFGGYMHMVHFNTTIPIDKIYRVDTSYVLTSDNKDWYQFWLKEDEQKVMKSLRPEKKDTGIFNLYETYGFKEGTFKSNEKDSITYKYEMMLNYSEQNWDWFGEECTESKYKRIKDFKILRLNYLVDNETYDVEVTMDNVDGKTLSIIDRSLILDEESNLYKIKSNLFEIKDGFDLARNVALSIIGVIVFLLIFYYGYKLFLAIRRISKNE